MGCCSSDEYDGSQSSSVRKVCRPNENEIDLSHFRMLNVMGQGGFGVVRMGIKVSGVDCGRRYAIKCLVKKSVLERASGPSSVLTELRALAVLDSPFICNSHYAFQSPTCLYLVLDLALGGDMRYNLKFALKNRFPEATAKFFICQVLLAVEACHKQHILHRDIKPENLLMKETGYLMLSDFGISKILPDIEDCRGTSGTHGYMAPEIYLPRHKHGTPAQWFAVGVTLHELVTGRRPFDSAKIKACRGGLDKATPSLTLDYLKACSFLSAPCKNFIQSCLVVQPKLRLGSSYGLREFAAHRWLSDVDWDGIRSQTLRSPFLPDITYPRTDLKREEEIHILEKLEASEPIPESEQYHFERYGFRNRYYSCTKNINSTQITQPESGDPQAQSITQNIKWTFTSDIKNNINDNENDNDNEKVGEDFELSSIVSADKINPNPNLRIHTDKKVLSQKHPLGSSSYRSATIPPIVKCLGPMSSSPAIHFREQQLHQQDDEEEVMVSTSIAAGGAIGSGAGGGVAARGLVPLAHEMLMTDNTGGGGGGGGSGGVGRESLPQVSSNKITTFLRRLPLPDEVKPDYNSSINNIINNNSYSNYPKVWARNSASSASIVTEDDDKFSLPRGVLSVPDSLGSKRNDRMGTGEDFERADSPLP
eukprot:gene5709-11520_t